MDSLENQWVAGGQVLYFVFQGHINSLDLLVEGIRGE